MGFSDLPVGVGVQPPSKKYLKVRFLEHILEGDFGQSNAYNSTNTDRSQVPFADSSSSLHFTQNMSLSAISKILAFQKSFMESPPFAKMPKMTNFSCLEN